MRIGLISDTHIPEAAKSLPHDILKAFSGVDLILHAGDIFVPSVLDELQSIAPVLAAKGDDDWGAIESDKRLNREHILKINGRTIWLIHQRPSSYTFVTSQFQSTQDVYDSTNIIVFGHEHRPVVDRRDNILFINPGSPTFLHYRIGPGTVGILDIESGNIHAQILEIGTGSIVMVS